MLFFFFFSVETPDMQGWWRRGEIVETCSSGFNERLAGVERRMESK